MSDTIYEANSHELDNGEGKRTIKGAKANFWAQLLAWSQDVWSLMFNLTILTKRNSSAALLKGNPNNIIDHAS